MGDFATAMGRHGVEIANAALESPWQNGKCERHGGIWKTMYHKVCVDQGLAGELDIIRVTSILNQTKNDLYRHDGFSPSQWVLGARGVRIPGSLLQPEEAARLEVHEAAEDPGSEMARNLAIRESAKIAYARADNSSRIRRALLQNTRHHDGPFPVGSAVYYRRAQVRRGESPIHRWFGVARVVGHEGRGHGVWARHGWAIFGFGQSTAVEICNGGGVTRLAVAHR